MARIGVWCSAAGPAEPMNDTLHVAPADSASAGSRPLSSTDGVSGGEGGATVSRAQKRSETIAARRAATGFHVGDRVRINTPKTPRYDGRVGTVEGTCLGEVGVAGAWFRPDELERVQ